MHSSTQLLASELLPAHSECAQMTKGPPFFIVLRLSGQDIPHLGPTGP